jgi:predicted Zn-dependent protease
MAMSPGLDDASRRSLLDQLKQHPLLDDEGRFSAWDLESHLNDRDSKVVLQQVVEFFKTADLQRKSKAAQWLNNHGQSELALELAKPPDSSANQELLLARLDALANLKNWAEVEKELSVTGIPLPQSLIYLYTARSAQELGDLPRSQTAWEKARSAAVTEPGMLVYLGEYALKLGAYDEAGKTFSVMSRQSPEQALKYYTLLVQTEARSGQNTQLMQTLKQMTVDLPYEPEPKNDWAYLNLLLNTNVDEASKVAEALVKAHPQILAYRSTLALAYLRKNDPADAAKVYQGLQIDWSSAPASWKLIYAVVLAANGDKAKAQGFISGITRDQVRPEESALMNAYLGLH